MALSGSTSRAAGAATRSAFTLVELLVVIAIIAVLLAAVVTVGGWAVRKGQSKNTEAVLHVVAQACDQFANEKPLASVKQEGASGGLVTYANRYGDFPPDELEVFTKAGLPGSKPDPKGHSLAPSGALAVPDASSGYPEFLYYREGNPKPEMENRDMIAMVLAIELFSETAAATLDHVPTRNRVAPPQDGTGEPMQFLDRNANGKFDADDEPVRWIVDDWRHPIGYMSQRDYRANGGATASSNHKTDWSWNDISTRLVKLNGNAPVIFSWGPDGDEQLTSSGQASTTAANLGADLMGSDGSVKDVIDNPMNLDNVYSNPALSSALTRGK